MLVGKNGCGKSTVMDLLGTTDQDRKREFPMYEKDEWPFDGKVWDPAASTLVSVVYRAWKWG